MEEFPIHDHISFNYYLVMLQSSQSHLTVSQIMNGHVWQKVPSTKFKSWYKCLVFCILKKRIIQLDLPSTLGTYSLTSVSLL